MIADLLPARSAASSSRHSWERGLALLGDEVGFFEAHDYHHDDGVECETGQSRESRALQKVDAADHQLVKNVSRSVLGDRLQEVANPRAVTVPSEPRQRRD